MLKKLIILFSIFFSLASFSHSNENIVFIDIQVSRCGKCLQYASYAPKFDFNDFPLFKEQFYLVQRLREDFQCKWSEFHMRLLRVFFGSPIFQGRMQVVSFAARYLTSESSFGEYETCQRRLLRLEIQITMKTLFD